MGRAEGGDICDESLLQTDTYQASACVWPSSGALLG